MMNQETFDILFEQWKRDTGCMSSMSQIRRHPVCDRFLDEGTSLLPMIFQALERKRDHRLMMLLNGILGFTPVPQVHWGKMDIVTKYWLDWGREHGYLQAKKEELKEEIKIKPLNIPHVPAVSRWQKIKERFLKK